MTAHDPKGVYALEAGDEKYEQRPYVRFKASIRKALVVIEKDVTTGKEVLSKLYGGKTGEQLRKALLRDGFQAVLKPGSEQIILDPNIITVEHAGNVDESTTTPMLEAWLNEAAALKMRFVKSGNYQVTDMGNVGWFRVYSVLPVFNDDVTHDNSEMASREDLEAAEQKHGMQELRATLKTIRQGPKEARLTDALVHSRTYWPHVAAQIKAASDTLQAAGFPRQKRDLFIAPMKHQSNRITGRTGNVAGFAGRELGAIALSRNTAMNNTSYIPDVVIHEWAHMYWFQLDKASRAFFEKWFKDNIVKSATEKTPDTLRFPENGIQPLLQAAWEGFSKGWARSNHISPAAAWGITEPLPRDDRAFIDYYLSRNSVVFARASKNFPADARVILGTLKDVPDSTVIKKGERLVLDVWGTIQYTPKALLKLHWPDAPDAKNRDFPIQQRMIPDFLEIDRKETSNYGGDADAKLLSDTAAHFKQLTTASNYFSPLANAAFLMNSWAGKKLDNSSWRKHDFIAVEKYKDFASEFIALLQASVDDKNFDIEEGFKAVMSAFLRLEMPLAKDPMAVASRLDQAEGDQIRSYIAQNGLSPTAYGASNASELWAETVTYYALYRSRVSKTLKKVFEKVLSGV
jgi:hypothetical protein